MKPPVVVGGLRFRTKTEAKRYFGDIRHRYQDGERLGPEDDGLIRQLLMRHPESAQKIGVGVNYFTIDTDRRFRRTRHFRLHRADGSSTDFSFKTCIDGRDERRDRMTALRRAVEEQIITFRESAFLNQSPVCPLRGLVITRQAYHVDHSPPATFAALVQSWLASNGLELTDVPITPPRDEQVVAEMTDTAQMDSWRTHHRQHARLRMLSPRANLSDARRQRLAPGGNV